PLALGFAADVERGRLSRDDLQWRDLQLSRVTRPLRTRGSSLLINDGWRGHPALVGDGRTPGARATEWDLCGGDHQLGHRRGLHRTRPPRSEAPLLLDF